MLSPLLPLLQAIPLQIETARNSITDPLLHILRTTMDPQKTESARNPNSTPKSSNPVVEECSSSTLVSAETSSSLNILSPTRKRPRLDANSNANRPPAVELPQRKSIVALSESTRHLNPIYEHPRKTGKSPRSLWVAESTPSRRKPLALSTYGSGTRHAFNGLRRPPRGSRSSFPSKEVMRQDSIVEIGGLTDADSRRLGQSIGTPIRPVFTNNPRLVPSHCSYTGPTSSNAGLSTEPQVGPSQATPITQGGIKPSVFSPTVMSEAQPRASGISPLSSDAAIATPRRGVTRTLSHWRVDGPRRYSPRALSNNTNTYSIPSNTAQKPMSIKDRKAHHVLAQGASVRFSKSSPVSY